ncbi:MAG: glycoside hydrolase family 38 C-terminal domain-containing protein [Eubacteriales bacterium]
MSINDKLVALASPCRASYWGERIFAQLSYSIRLSSVKEGKYDTLIISVQDFLLARLTEDGVVTNSAAKAAEEMLAPLSADAKAIKVYCVSHAHIDMNWMWGMQETAAVTVDTFRTVLELMKAYPALTFSQSQASVYKIIEEYAPEMIPEIKQRIHEGRWEITASTWVENDKNMPNGESMARHILYAKNYLSKLFDIPTDSMKLDFEPDTFGHNRSLPEIMNKGGVKYYYHNRANDSDHLSIWKAPSGAKVLVYRDLAWYNASIEYTMLTDIPQFCDKYGVDVYLKVYGVGDHGGGPTRRDVERIIDMATWPIMPVIEFGTYHKYFSEVEKFADKFAVVDREMNFVFTGCYTSQSRVKMSNRISEDKLYEAEALTAAAGAFGGVNKSESFAKAWENVLFNHFHDILPGSGKVETREYALGLFQKTMAYANTNTTQAMNTLAASIDTSSIPFIDDKSGISEGGGVGFFVEQGAGFAFPQTERGRGMVRAFHVFNPTQFRRKGPVEITVWDWPYDTSVMTIKDSSGKDVEYKFIQGGSHYWGHTFFRVVIDATVPAFGYATYTLNERSRTEVPNSVANTFDNRCDYISDDDIVLENDKVKAVFSAGTMHLLSFVDKATGKDMVCSGYPSAFFRLIDENPVHGMTSWRVGEYMTVTDLNATQQVRIQERNLGGIRKWVRYEIKFRSSSMTVVVSLDERSSTLRFGTTVDWHETGVPGQLVQQLNFIVPLAYDTTKYRYDIPFGTLDREGTNHDMPANSFVAALSEDGTKPAMVITDTKYGFRTNDNSIAVDLIRSSYDPDPYPEYGIHSINLGLAIAENGDNLSLYEVRDAFIYKLPFVSATKHTGSLPLDGTLLSVAGDVRVAAIKQPEDGDSGLVVRVHDAEGKGSKAVLSFAGNVSGAMVTDITEKEMSRADVSGGTVSVPVAPFEVQTVKISL